MYDSLVMPSAPTRSDFPSDCSHSGTCYCGLEGQFDVLYELHIGNSAVEVSNISEETGSTVPCLQRKNAALSRIQLEQDVQRLQKQLLEEMELHTFLKNVTERNVINLSSPAHLPHHVQDLSNIAILETTVSKLEQEMLSLHFQLSQERNERRLAEYHLRHSSSQSVSSCSSDIMNAMVTGYEKKESTSTKLDGKSSQPANLRKFPKRMPPKGIWDQPSFLSEEMVRCMKDIFMSLADSDSSTKSSVVESHCSAQSPPGHLHSSLWWSSSELSTTSSWPQSPQGGVKDCEVLAFRNACDPYHVRGKLSWADIGNYGSAIEVSWMSVGKKQLEYAAGALLRFRILVEQLAKALLLALHKLKVSEEQRKLAIDGYEPLVAFALSCGMYSSPAVKIYTPKTIREELQDAQRDFIRAAVGVSSRGRLLVPKMLHCFAKGFVDDANLAVWISHYLPPSQAALVEQCISQRRQSILGSRNCGILPFNSRFRYLFLPDKFPSNRKSC